MIFYSSVIVILKSMESKRNEGLPCSPFLRIQICNHEGLDERFPFRTSSVIVTKISYCASLRTLCAFEHGTSVPTHLRRYGAAALG
jgi:hypothetical protein